MEFGLATYGLSLAAGALSTLSPCVLPLVPILLGTSLAADRLGPYALAAGLALSFTLIGVLLSSLGAAAGLDPVLLRRIAAILLIGFGATLLSARLQERFAAATSGLSNFGQARLARFSPDGLAGQFVLGLLLGVVWTPCVGPTLGAAITLASQGKDLGQVALSMAMFGIGAASPMLLLGLASRAAVARVRGRLLATGRVGKLLLGAMMLLLGAMILSGTDKALEAWALNSAPDWLIRLTTSI